MKKLLIIVLTLILMLSFASCGDKEEKEGVSVDEGIINVDITLPASFFEGVTDQEIVDNADSQGIKDCKVNDNGSVTYTVSKAKRNEMLDDMKVSLDETIESFLEGEDEIESIDSVEYNDDLSKFDVYLNSEPSLMTYIGGLSFFITGAYYQMFNGVDADSVDVIIDYIDVDTEEIIETMSYREWIENQEEE